MILKNNYQAIEPMSLIVRAEETKLILPSALIEEIEDFAERNSLAVVGHTLHDRRPLHRCCPACLKAHILKVSEELNLNRKLVFQLSRTLPSPIGHNGYYIDEDKLINANLLYKIWKRK